MIITHQGLLMSSKKLLVAICRDEAAAAAGDDAAESQLAAELALDATAQARHELACLR